MIHVKPVMAPHAGQSVNPALQAHKEVLKKVISEEEKEIEDNYKSSFQRSKDEANHALEKLKVLKKQRKAKGNEDKDSSESNNDSDSDESGSSSDSEMESDSGDGKVNKPVNRLKKLT